MVKVMSLLTKPESALEVVFRVRAQTEMKKWCVTGMCIVSSETDLGVKGLIKIEIVIPRSYLLTEFQGE